MKRKIKISDPVFEGLAAARQKDRYTAEAEGLSFQLSLVLYREIILQNCHYCGAKPTTPFTTQDKRSTLDRKDRLGHFTRGNSIPVCRHCYSARRKVSPKVAARIALIAAKETAEREWAR